jgi:phage I-like protein
VDPRRSAPLSEQTQKYISPTFLRDAENRVRVFANAALVADPATYGTPALVAANNRRGLPMLKNHKSVAAMIATLSARVALAKAKMVKLADAPADGADAGPKGKGAAMKSAAEAAQTSIEELLKAADGNDIDAVFAAMDAA